MSNFHHPRKPYGKPHLIGLGDLRTLTMGGSPGALDSGSSTVRKPVGSLPQPVGVRRPDGSILLPDGSILLLNGNILPPS
jgi:hypothetical protein